MASSFSEIVDRVYPPTQHTRKPAVYEAVYESVFEGMRARPLKFLELGVHSGHSLLLWHEYFPQAEIVGLDIRPRPDNVPPHRVRFVQGRQESAEAIAEVGAHGPFDVIVDDASHLGSLTKRSFELLFEAHLVPGGLYVIEDIAASVRFPNWPDYRPMDAPREENGSFVSYNAGIIGFLKQLIDVAAYGNGSIDSITVHRSIAVIRKTRQPVAGRQHC